eukprot:CAMPEP_0117505470 /NCGR_PEP_ID=MMETSP0784-20121206/25395_1 /TAXON_ID=39447 /ORGANISM="" /LENGTH=733 /DNA_ID=CAMNT_0005300885 /DNA_START=1 /DNA_END=2198 /DNA_ORIENTATION=+
MAETAPEAQHLGSQGPGPTRSNVGSAAVNVADIQGSDVEKRMMYMTVGRLAQAPDRKAVSTRRLQQYVRESRQHQRDCAQFPCMIMFFVMFAVTVLMHEDISNVSQVERNFRNMLEGTTFEGTLPQEYGGHFVSGHKSMEDIDVVVDIWTYLQDAVIPLFIQDLDRTHSDDINRVLRYNQLIGGIQLQQIRRTKVDCITEYPNLGPKEEGTDVNPLLVGFFCYPWNKYAKTCFGPDNATEGFCPDSNGDATAASARLLSSHDTGRWLGGGRRLQGPQHANQVKGESGAAIMGLDTFSGGMYTVTLHEHEGFAASIAKIKKLKQLEWIDAATAWFGIKMFVINPDVGVYTHVIVNVWFPLSGELIPAVTMSSFPAEPYQYMSVVASDATWGLLWLVLLIGCVSDLCRSVRKKELKTYLSVFWNWLNWVSVLGGMLILILWLVFLSTLGTVQKMSMDVVQARPSSALNFEFESPAQAEQYAMHTHTLHAEVARLSGFLMYYRLFICWYTIVIMVRFFQAFLAQPKLAIVTNTVLRSIPDVLHFMIVLMLVFLAYSVAGMFLFGHRLLMFSQLDMALQSCFLIMLGDFDYAELSNEHLFTSALWFVSFMVLVALIMLNMVLAIIMDIYTEVKMDAEEQDPIWTQLIATIRGMLSRREWVKLAVVEDVLTNWEGAPETVDKDVLLIQVDGMPAEQAIALIEEADKLEAREETKGLTISDAMKMVGWIKIAVQKIAAR